jgi:hypothetical protein
MPLMVYFTRILGWEPLSATRLVLASIRLLTLRSVDLAYPIPKIDYGLGKDIRLWIRHIAFLKKQKGN